MLYVTFNHSKIAQKIKKTTKLISKVATKEDTNTTTTTIFYSPTQFGKVELANIISYN